MATSKKRKKKKKKRYITGVHKSLKCTSGKIKYRSGWEKTVALHLDFDPLVESYEYENLKIPYISNQKTKKVRHYIPDFLVYYSDGTQKLIEVKPNYKLHTSVVIKKAAAGKEWARKNGAEYVFWSNTIIAALKKIQETKSKCQKKQTTTKKKKKS